MPKSRFFVGADSNQTVMPLRSTCIAILWLLDHCAQIKVPVVIGHAEAELVEERVVDKPSQLVMVPSATISFFGQALSMVGLAQPMQSSAAAATGKRRDGLDIFRRLWINVMIFGIS